MGLKAPFATKIGRGAYSAIVFKDGDLYVAEDNVGTVIKESTDTATAIQSALNSLTQGGKLVLGLEGEHLISTSINLPAVTGIGIEGLNIGHVEKGTSLKLANGANCSLFTLDTASHAYFYVFSDFELNGNKANQSATSHGFNIIKDTSDCYFERLIIRDFRDDGMHFLPTQYLWNVWIHGCLVENNIENGLLIDGTTAPAESWVLSENYFYGNKIGLNINKGTSLRILGNHFWKNTRENLKIANTPSSTYPDFPLIVTNNILGGASEETADTYANILITSASHHNLIQSNIVRKYTPGGANKSKYGIRIDAGCTGNRIFDNDLYDGGVTANFSDGGTGTVTRDNRII